jgi:hypothetical protein
MDDQHHHPKDQHTKGLDWGRKTCPWSLPFVFFVGGLKVVFAAACKIELWEGIEGIEGINCRFGPARLGVETLRVSRWHFPSSMCFTNLSTSF